MHSNVKEVLHILKEHGYEGYIVGGYVRDYLLKRNSNDYDICTNATPNVLKELFQNYSLRQHYGTITLLFNDFKIEITTYRKELKYYKRKPVQYLFTDSLTEDLKRRDFTINTICMDENENIIDLLDGKKDLKRKIIRCVGDVDQKLSEDPLRILRAIRFKAYLNFEIDAPLSSGIQKYKHLLKELSYERKKEEINYLIKKRSLKILDDYHLTQELELRLSDIKYYDDELLTWYTIDPKGNYLFSHYEEMLVRSLSHFIASAKTPYDLYIAGDKIARLTDELLNTNYTCQYANLPIKRRQDIKISSVELIRLFPNQKIGKLYSLLEEEILNHSLSNQKEAIMSYLNNLKHTL